MRNTVGSGPVVMVASGEESMADSLANLLQDWRYQVEMTATGQDALARLEEAHPPAIALLDMDLPGPGGVEIVRALTQREEQRSSWLMLMSQLPGKDRMRTAVESGCDDFLLLPADPLDFRVRIRVAERVRALQSQLQRQSAELRYQATHDSLTGLWNREALLSLVFQETDRVQRMKTDLCLMLLDLDQFSTINHDYGYQAGDKVLTGLANRFRRQMRSYDLIGRMGEDEFLLALPGCGRETATVLAERIQEIILAKPFPLGNDATTLRASFGIATSGGRSPLVVLREAERALAEAKLAGRNCVRCYPSPESPSPVSLLTEGAGWDIIAK